MYIEKPGIAGSTVDPEVISRLLSKYVEELQGLGLRDHIWLLFALDDMEAYCKECGLHRVGQAFGLLRDHIDDEILASSSRENAIH